MQSFEQLSLSQGTLNAVAAMGFESPTPVQQLAIPPLLAGRDVVVQARTGTGKTAAFGIPLTERARKDSRARGIVALVLVPTRELAVQVSAELAELAKGSNLSIVPVYGGVGFGNQIKALNATGPRIVVATPGRLLDHLSNRNGDLSHVQTCILDEADRMLDMGFLPDVRRILECLPARRQNALFSATLPEPIKQLASRFLHDAAHLRVETGPVSVPETQQFFLDTHPNEKLPVLLTLLKKEQPGRAIVFTRTKHLAKRLAGKLERAGWNAVALQGNMSQNARERAMLAFREGTANVLVATDVAGRGIDVPEVSHVINFDIPTEPDAYVHRIGRTGRMGREGKAFTFVQADQHRDAHDIEKASGRRLEPYELGPLVEVREETNAHFDATRGQRRGQSNGNGNGAHHGRAPVHHGGSRRHTGGGQRRHGGPRQGPQHRKY